MWLPFKRLGLAASVKTFKIDNEEITFNLMDIATAPPFKYDNTLVKERHSQ